MSARVRVDGRDYRELDDASVRYRTNAMQRGALIPLIRMVDIAPTIASLLGVELPDADGNPIMGIFNEPAASGNAKKIP